MTHEESDLDLGHGHALSWLGYYPGDFSPPGNGPDIERYGALIWHSTPDGADCAGSVIFDTIAARRGEPAGKPMWSVESFDPLTISPSVLCRRCGDHGFIRDGRWVPA